MLNKKIPNKRQNYENYKILTKQSKVKWPFWLKRKKMRPNWRLPFRTLCTTPAGFPSMTCEYLTRTSRWWSTTLASSRSRLARSGSTPSSACLQLFHPSGAMYLNWGPKTFKSRNRLSCFLFYSFNSFNSTQFRFDFTVNIHLNLI